jgi:hypothetical protein
MSSRESACAATDAHSNRIQRKWGTLLRRADARESALRRALAHAHITEAELRLQLDREQRRHAIESGLLRERLRRLEQTLLSCVSTGSRALRSPLTALRNVGALGSASASVTGSVSASRAPVPMLAPAPTLEAQAPAPFDPIATVESLLPMSKFHAGAPEADIAGALDRLQAVVQNTGAGHASADQKPILRAPRTPRTHDLPGERPTVEHNAPQRGDERVIGSDTPWFPRAFRRLAEEDLEAAGRLFLQLLTAQGLVWPEDVRYRIEVAEIGTLAVDVSAGHCTVQHLLKPGAPPAGEPTLRTDLAGLARAVAGRRGWARVGARISSSRNRHMRPLRALAAAPLQLSDLKRADVKVDPVLLLRLLALAIDPAWTADETFVVACRWRGRVGSACYIHVFESTPVAVTRTAPLGEVSATLSCEPRDLLEILLGDLALGDSLAQVSGDQDAIASLLEWFQRVDATATTIPAETPAAVA